MLTKAEWLNNEHTQKMIGDLERLKLDRALAIPHRPKDERDEACGEVKGITFVISLIKSAEDE